MPATGGDQSEIDAALQNWQQGDAIVGSALSFLHIADLSRPLSDVAREEAAQGFDAEDSLTTIGTSVAGLVVISQTCDVVKPCDKLAYVQMAALVRVDADLAREVQACLRPQKAHLPGVFDQGLVVDLEKIMTIEKSVLLALPTEHRVRGLRNNAEVRSFAGCLSRKFSRFAFPV